MTVIVVAIAGYVVAYPALVWTLHDLRRYPRQLWTGFGRPHPRGQATVIVYLAGGLPVFIVALAWRASNVRQEMRDAAHRSDRRVH